MCQEFLHPGKILQWNDNIRYQKVIKNGRNFYRFWVKMQIIFSFNDLDWRYVTSVDDFLLGLQFAEEKVGEPSI